MQWPVVYVVQVRKLKAENGSRVGQRPSQKPALPSASSLGGHPVRSRLGARGWLPRFRDTRPPPRSCGAAAVSLQAGELTPTPASFGRGLHPGDLEQTWASAPSGGLSCLPARVGCGHLAAAGSREHPSLGGSVGRALLLPCSRRRALRGADEAPQLPASPGGLGTGKLLSWDMKGHFIHLAK